MSQAPSPYDRQYNFTNFQSSNPTTPLPGQKVDQELNAARTTLNATLSRLNEIQADDGKVRNSALNLTTIAEQVELLLTAAPIQSVNQAGSNQVLAVNAAGVTKVAAVNSAGAAQIAAINAAINTTTAQTAVNAANTATQQAQWASAYKDYTKQYYDGTVAYYWLVAESLVQAQNKATEAGQSSIEAANSAASASSSATLAANDHAYAAAAAGAAESSKMAALDAKAEAEYAAATATSIVQNGAASIVTAVQPFLDAAAASATSAHDSANDALASKTAAQTSATAAAGSASNASSSASNAATSATNASSSASSAATSATNAAGSATSAGNSASQAGSASNGASTSATNAANSASAAATSASDATTAKNAAETAATAADASATAAAGSAASASGHANNAASYATNASNSADAASASETAASGYASDASASATAASGSASAAAASASSFSLAIGTVTTGSVGSSAAATVTGTAPTYTLDLTIPTGANGANGANGTSLTMRGNWSYGTTYAAGDVAIYSGQAYAAINSISPSYSDPATDTFNWAVLTIVGPAGSNGVNGTSLVVVGNWVNGTTYSPGQIAIDSGVPYVCLNSVYSIIAPSSDTTNWVMLTIVTTPKAVYSTGTISGVTHTIQSTDPSDNTTPAEFKVQSSAYANPVRVTPAGVYFNDGTLQSSAGISLATANATYATISSLNLKANIASPTFTGKVTTAGSSTSGAGFRLPSGTAPTTPVSGDLFFPAGGRLSFFDGTTTNALASINAIATWTAKQSFTPSASSAMINVGGVNSDPTTLTVVGDLWFNNSAGKLKYSFGSAAVNVASETWVTSQGYAIGTNYAALAGATFTGKVNTVASNNASAGLNIPSGSAPTTPTTGDLWFDGTRLVFRTSSLSANIASSGTTTTYSAGVKQTFTHNVSTAGMNIAPVATAPTTPASGDVWHDTSTGVNQIVGWANGMRGVMTACRAFVNFNGTGTVAIRAGFNVSSITDNGVGDYTVNFGVAMPDVNYVVASGTSPAAGTSATAGAWFAGVRTDATGAAVTKTTSACRVATAQLTSGTLIDCPEVYFTFFR